MTPETPTDIVILSNGPGEVATWVKPVTSALRARAPHCRISVVLSPCPHASGQEPLILKNSSEVDRVQAAPHFFKFLLTGRTADNWNWHPNGVVVFLGGDQLYTVLIAKRLGYRSVTYAEWDARWTGLVDRFGVMKAKLVEKVPAAHKKKFTVVGDLMADVQASADRAAIAQTLGCAPDSEIIGFLPGSKPPKLGMGVPMLLSLAQILSAERPNAHFVIGVAPNLTLTDLMRYADPRLNPAIKLLEAPPVQLVEPSEGLPYIQIHPDRAIPGPKISLWQRFPALDLFSQCALCFTTVGANTAQLGALATPMIVLLPTQRLGALQLADGLPGVISRMPGVGALVRRIINPIIIAALQKSGKRFAWPNIWAKREVVPELFGPITPQDAADAALDYLNHPENLAKISQTLRNLRGPAGAAEKMAALILETVNYPK